MIDFAAEVTVALAPVVSRLDEIAARLERLEAAAPPRLLTVGEVARSLGVSTPTVWRRIRAGSLPVRRVGRSVRIDARVLHPASAAEVAALAAEARR